MELIHDSLPFEKSDTVSRASTELNMWPTRIQYEHNTKFYDYKFDLYKSL